MVLVAALVGILASGQAGADVPRVGVLLSTGDGYVLALEGPAVEPGTVVTAIDPDGRQRVFEVASGGLLGESPEMASHMVVGPFYRVQVPRRVRDLPRLAVALVGRVQAVRDRDGTTLRLTRPRVDVRVRGCTSTEGLHLTVWAGTPLRSRRLWHTYFYLGYDVEPTCTEADYRDGG